MISVLIWIFSCLLVSLLILWGILEIIFYKKRKRKRQKQVSEPTIAVSTSLSEKEIEEQVYESLKSLRNGPENRLRL